jgi:hypothetical protein
MPPLTADRNTPMKDGEELQLPVAGGANIKAGAIVAAAADGYVQQGATATTLTYLGRAEEAVDNSAGADGDKKITIRRGKAFKWKNSGVNAVGQSLLGKDCWIEDDETVAGTDGGATRSKAGKVVGIDSDGVWVL